LQPRASFCGPYTPSNRLQNANTTSSGLLRTRTISSGFVHGFFSVLVASFMVPLPFGVLLSVIGYPSVVHRYPATVARAISHQ
jgi:hypothetical protein